MNQRFLVRRLDVPAAVPTRDDLRVIDGALFDPWFVVAHVRGFLTLVHQPRESQRTLIGPVPD